MATIAAWAKTIVGNFLRMEGIGVDAGADEHLVKVGPLVPRR